MARIIEEFSGQPYETYVVDQILIPLQMESPDFLFTAVDNRYAKGQYLAAKTDLLITQLNVFRGRGQEVLILDSGKSFAILDNSRVLPPWGGLLGTPIDVTHFLRMHMNSGRFGDTQILKPETAEGLVSAWEREK